MKKGKCKLMEPVMRVDVLTPEDHMGDVIGDLNSRRGMVRTCFPRIDSSLCTRIGTDRGNPQGTIMYCIDAVREGLLACGRANRSVLGVWCGM